MWIWPGSADVSSRDQRFFNVNEGKGGKVGLWRPHEEFLVAPQDDGFQDQLEEPPPDEDYPEESSENNYEDEAVVF